MECKKLQTSFPIDLRSFSEDQETNYGPKTEIHTQILIPKLPINKLLRSELKEEDHANTLLDLTMRHNEN